MSFLNANHTTFTLARIPPHVTKAHVLNLLHDHDKMIRLNPIVKSYRRLPDSASEAFFKNEPAERKASSSENDFPVYEVVEDIGGVASEDGTSSAGWRGGWAKRFIPDSITYETSILYQDNGCLAITHAPMGVHSITTWLVKEDQKQDIVLESTVTVTSNRMLMGFIKTTLQESHETLVKEFVAVLEKELEKAA